MKLSAHEFAKAVLAYDKSLRRYNFEEIPASPLGEGRQPVKMAGMTIAEIASA